ncbi:MAG: UbiA family prenyltransferase [Candidatus Micrarchaeota archaeon]|nr:UbiA family prenyltransferase [Candidatus Micrarchaeota archaeon]
MGKIAAILKLTRIEHSIMLVIAVIAAELIVNGGMLPATPTLVFSLVTPIFISMGAFAINDYFDIKVDRANKKNRPLVTGALKPGEALYIAIATILIGIASSYFINIYCFAIAIFFGAMSLLYSYRLKEMLFWGNAYVALSMVIPFAYGNYVVSSSLSWAIVIVSVLIFSSGLAREIHGTIRDLKGDTKIRNAKTIPKYIGRKAASIVALLLYLFAIALSMYLFLQIPPFQSSAIYAILVALTDLMLLYVGVGFVANPRQEFYDRTRNVSLAAMGVALIAFLIVPLI